MFIVASTVSNLSVHVTKTNVHFAESCNNCSQSFDNRCRLLCDELCAVSSVFSLLDRQKIKRGQGGSKVIKKWTWSSFFKTSTKHCKNFNNYLPLFLLSHQHLLAKAPTSLTVKCPSLVVLLHVSRTDTVLPGFSTLELSILVPVL